MWLFVVFYLFFVFLTCFWPLQIVINPNQEVSESDFTNNAMKCNCKYDGHRVWLHNCHIGNQCKNPSEPPVHIESFIQTFALTGFGLFWTLAGDAFSEEAERRFEKYPGQLNNHIP